MATAPARTNPYAAFNFFVVIQNTTVAGFMEVTGLDVENAVIEYREGIDQNLDGAAKNSGAFVRKLPGLERYPNVTLRRGITGDLRLWNDLRMKVRDGTLGPELGAISSPTPSVTINLQDEKHNTVQTWTLQNAWVAKLSGPMLNAKSNEIAIESIELVCDRIVLSAPNSGTKSPA
jgi:phage tail-like protein